MDGSTQNFIKGSWLLRLVARLELTLFKRRFAVLLTFGVFTLCMAVLALGLRMSAGFEKTLPQQHEYIKTFNQYREALFGANRLIVVVHARHGTIWNPPVLRQLLGVTEAVNYLQGVDRSSVMSLWTPNVFFTEITEDGFKAMPITGGDIIPEKLNPQVISDIRDRVAAGGYLGNLVSRDQTSAMVLAELQDSDPQTRQPLDYRAFNQLLENKVRKHFENADVEIQIIGFAKAIGDIGEEASRVTAFFGIALLLTGLSVYWYCRSWRLTLLPLVCSLSSLVWQFGTLRLLGFGLDPLAILVPFLVFAIGVSHGVQQINFIVREIADGKNTELAARHSFTGLLIPGTLALVTAFISFITLTLIPIPMIRELAIAASIGVGYKIITNLVMLPLAASYFSFSQEYAQRAIGRREQHSRWLSWLALVARPRNAWIVVGLGVALFSVAVWQSQGRHVGSLQAGADELRPEARFNRDAADITSRFNVGLDWLTVVFEVAPNGKLDACARPDAQLFMDDFAQQMGSVPGVMSIRSVADVLKGINAGLNEGNPKMTTITRDARGLGSQFGSANDQLHGFSSSDCRAQGVNLYLSDHKATTIKGVVAAVEKFRQANHLSGVNIRLASGNAGVLAATNEVLEKSELPMMLYVYAAILVLVLLAYRDWRAMLACCLPLTVATWLGYWFMKDLNIGLTVATLPVMVLATGIGVDYAFYIYNRLQLHLGAGMNISNAVERALHETGVATIFTALTLSIGVATWSFSPLQFQADMGKLLTFMFLVNMVMAVTLLPAFAVVLESIFPRRAGAVHTSSLVAH
ncbi:efflux RND transporter permease subunit [Glaciimonas soli]|uniref:MMPL family transporter n=1 Tax=Glaciimonas soli TaxID=2590999 RepID=A0A843YJR8_9BURK|nr:efflux RND transporter permease subunit [Glaciimonas soli]MQQ99219.1 MMPL family transporter [Glaciimonas soli]